MARKQTPSHLRREFECVYLIRHDVEDHAVDKIVEKYREIVENNGGKVVGLESWGRRKLAYPIAKHRTAHYIHMEFFGTSELVHEVERNMRITEDVVRWLTVLRDPHADQESKERTSELKRRKEPEAETERGFEAAPREPAPTTPEAEKPKHEAEETKPPETTQA